MSQAILNTAKMVRQNVLQQIESIPEEFFDIQLEPFGNTIRWNVGHMIYTMSLGLRYPTDLPEHYRELFQRGTRPADWSVTPPAKQELVQYLTQQLYFLSEVSPGTLEKTLKTPLEIGSFTLCTVGEMYNFFVIHETIHHTLISSIWKMIRHQQKLQS